MAAPLPAAASRLMPRGIYDANNNNIVDTVDQLHWNDVLNKPSLYPPVVHTHSVDQIQGLSLALAGKSPTSHLHDDRYYTEQEVNDLLAGKSAVGHTHSTLYYSKSEINSLLQGLSPASHDHNSLYYTKTEIDNLVEDNISNTHNHDDRYYTESEVNALLASKSSSGHNHDSRYYTKSEVDALFASVGVGDNMIEFLTPALTWTVNHGLNRHPWPIILNTDNALMFAHVTYTDLNTLVISHSSPVAGRVFLN